MRSGNDHCFSISSIGLFFASGKSLACGSIDLPFIIVTASLAGAFGGDLIAVDFTSV